MRVLKNKMFFRWAKSEGLIDSALLDAAREIEQNLFEASLGGHLIKKRVARKGQGKRGGFRTIVAFQKANKIIFLYGFLKNQSDNIQEKEERALKKLAKYLLNASEKELAELIENKELYEVTT